MVTLAQALEVAQENDRVCPQPRMWTKLYEMLPDKVRKGNGWEPALPLILAAWWETSALQKMLRLREHIEWASENNCLDEIHSFMQNLKEHDWHHIGE